MLVTNLAVFTLNERTGQLEVTELLNGATRDQIAEETGFPVAFASDCTSMPPPARDVLDVLRAEVDPLGLRRLEFVAARDRASLFDEIIGADRAFAENALRSYETK